MSSSSDKAVVADIMSAFQAWQQTQTEYMARMAGQIINGVLLVETFVIPTAGYVAREWSVAAGAALVENHAETEVVSSSSGPSGDVPTSGVGVVIVPAQSARSHCLASRQLTIYGDPGARVTVQVVTHPVLTGFSAGITAVDGGAP